MTECGGHPGRLCLVLVVLLSITPKLARAGSGLQDKPIRVHTNETFGPIGRIYSFGAIMINGRPARGEQMLWGGELLGVAAGSNACVFLDAVGQITFKSAAMARLGSALSGFDENDTHHVLVASLLSGEMIVKLQQDARAYIESCGSAFESSNGANFHIGVRENQPMIEAINGSVTPQCKDEKKKIRLWVSCCVISGTLVPDSFPSKMRRGQIQRGLVVRVRMQECSQIRKTLFATLDGSDLSQVPQNEQPASGRRLRFTVEPPIAQFSARDFTTGPNGEVTVDFLPLREGPAKITVTVEDIKSDEEVEPWTWAITIVKPPIPRWVYYVGPPAVFGGIYCAIACRKKGPIRQVPPPIIP